MHIAILTKVKRCQMETKGFDRADQPAKRAAAGQCPLTGRGEGRSDGNQVAAKRLGRCIGVAVQPCRPRRRIACYPAKSGVEPCVNARQRPAVGFIAAAGRIVAACIGKVEHRLRDDCKFGRNRYLRPQLVHCFEIMTQHRCRPAGERIFESVCIDKGIAVTVPADPTAQPQEGWRALPQITFPARIQLGQGDKEHIFHIGACIFDLVSNDQFFTS